MSADLAAEIRAVLRRYARTMADGDGDPPRGLVGELVRIAQRHAIEENAAAVDRVLAARLEAFDPGQAPGLRPDKVIGLDQLPGSARAMPPPARTPRPKPARRRPSTEAAE